MAVTMAVPAEAMRGRYSLGDDHLEAGREAPDRGPAQDLIAEMAELLRDTRGSMLLGGSVLSALTIGIALEAAFSPSVLRPGLAGVLGVSLLGCVILCWLRAAALLLLAGLPYLTSSTTTAGTRAPRSIPGCAGWPCRPSRTARRPGPGRGST